MTWTSQLCINSTIDQLLIVNFTKMETFSRFTRGVIFIEREDDKSASELFGTMKEGIFSDVLRGPEKFFVNM